MDKSHVSMEQKICVVCGKSFDSGAILLDRRLRQSMERYTVTGWGLCPEHDRLKKEGYIALVECDASKSTIEGGVIRPSGAYRTRRLAHIKKKVYKRLFDSPIPSQYVVFVDKEIMDRLEKAQKEAEK